MKLAIVKLSALGDIVHAMVALQFIKAARPELQIDWIVEQAYADILQDNPHIERILPVNLKAIKNNKRLLWRELRRVKEYSAAGYDHVIDAQGLIKSALVARMLSPHCAGFDRHSIREQWAAMFYREKVCCPYDANTIDRNVTVLTRPLGIQISPQQILAKQPFLFFKPAPAEQAHYFRTDMANILLVIGSTWPSRNYPREQFLSVIQRLPANYLLVWGSEKEQQDATWLAHHGPANMLPRLNLNDLKAAIAHADLVIGNDTGPTHMAWALNRPSITLFGPTPISRVYQTSINKVLKSPSVVNPFKLNKNDFSITQIPPADVVKLADSLLIDG